MPVYRLYERGDLLKVGCVHPRCPFQVTLAKDFGIYTSMKSVSQKHQLTMHPLPMKIDQE